MDKYLTLTLKGLQVSPEVMYRGLYISPVLHDLNKFSKRYIGFDVLIRNPVCFFG